MTDPAPRPPRPRLPVFSPVPVRSRKDGWTPLRQCEFIGMLAQTGSVSAAAQFVGMTRETAYRLRRRRGAAEFARAWDVALAIAGVRPLAADGTRGPRKVTQDDPWRRILDGRWRPVVRRGKYVGSVQKPDNSALLGWLGQLDRSLSSERRLVRRRERSRARKGDRVSRGGGAPAADGGARV